MTDTNPNPNAQRQHDAQLRAENLSSFVLPLRADGKSLRQIASALAAERVPTANGGDWSAQQVQRILLRLDHRTASEQASRDPLAALVVPKQATPETENDPLAAMPLPVL